MKNLNYFFTERPPSDLLPEIFQQPKICMNCCMNTEKLKSCVLCGFYSATQNQSMILILMF